MRVRQVSVLLSCLMATAYFAHHAIWGRHGYVARQALIERSALIEFEIKSLENVQAKLRRDVALLTPEIADPDIVEEIARDVLGYARPSDIIVTQR